MSRYPSVEVALDALQARNEELERLVTERTAALEQAHRRAEVEAALERVRAQAMGIAHSDETASVAVAMFDELRGLQLPALQVGLRGPLQGDGANREVAVWVAGVDAAGAARASHFLTALSGHPVLDASFEAARKGATVVERMDPGAFEAYLRASVRRYPASYADLVVSRAPRAAEYHYVAAPVGGPRKGHVFAVLSEAPSEEVLWVLRRFSVLFSQAYARYQDLQQAEVHARKSQIEAALERVRAKALAMRRSADLGQVVRTVFQELDGLGVSALRSGIGIVDGTTRQLAFWAIPPRGAERTSPVPGGLLLDGHPLFHALFDAWRQQKDLSYILEGDDLRAYYAVQDRTRVPLLAPRATAGEREYLHAVACPAGVLYAFSEWPFSEETVQVMQRLAGAFHFAYTRYRDLQLAEAQAREAAQQASVDRVRAEIASMRTAADLDRITPLIWQELTTLGVSFSRCGVFIVDEDEGAVQVYLATPDGRPLAALRPPFDSHPLIGEIVTHWRRQAIYDAEWDAQQMEGWTAALVQHGLAESAAPPAQPPSFSLHFAPFAQGMLYVGSETPLAPDDGDAVQALADAFEVAYARYDDFQRLEAKNREVEETLAELKAAQQQLIQSEKLASLGQLTAGIAHEIKNPLNFVNNFAALSAELADELIREATSAPKTPLEEVMDVLADLQHNAEKIAEHGSRADSIVRAMLE
ncbi:MAG TPA: hypothetical protein VD962_09240, partial [Rubricoccaceae bacterium]|nr:hypothetical protein [Rubricoccaceae bacterium]